jgi:hypothetical protein
MLRNGTIYEELLKLGVEHIPNFAANFEYRT